MPRLRQALTSTPGDGRANCGSEPVAAAELGPDKVAVFAKSFAQRGDLNLQVLLRDNNAWPNTGHKLVFGDQRSVALQEDQQEIDRTTAPAMPSSGRAIAGISVVRVAGKRCISGGPSITKAKSSTYWFSASETGVRPSS